ncbi:LysR family transcriptional regulator [Chitinimonas naiadis]
MLDLNDVAIFVQVVREGSFAAAGRRLGIPANTLSRRLQMLEAALGTRLLLRSTRKLSLTPAGREFFERSASGIAGIEQARLALLESDTPKGVVRVAAPADFFDHFAMEHVAEFMALHPQVQLEFLLSDTRIDLIAEGVDVAFRAGVINDATMVARKMAESVLLLVASPDYLQRRGHPANMAALAEHDCLVVASVGSRVVWRLQGPTGPEEVKVVGRLASNTAQSVLRAVRAGLGIALLPSVVAGGDIVGGRLERVLPQYQQDLGGVHIVYPGRYRRTLAVTTWVEFVQQRIVASYARSSPR